MILFRHLELWLVSAATDKAVSDTPFDRDVIIRHVYRISCQNGTIVRYCRLLIIRELSAAMAPCIHICAVGGFYSCRIICQTLAILFGSG